MINKEIFWAGLGIAGCAFISSDGAQAANCSALSYPLTNGTTADANQVMGNFNGILNCANNNLAPLANPSFTGKVGIGNAAPSNTLEINTATGLASARIKSASAGGAYLFLDRSANSLSYSTQIYFQSAGLSDFGMGTSTGTAAPSDWSLYNYGTAANIITIPRASGYVGIGTVAPGYPLQVNGSAAATAFVTTSDARLKKDVEPISGALTRVQQLRGVSFAWKVANEREVGKDLTLPTDQRQLGFIAQEVAAVVPEAVISPKKGSNDPYALKEADLIPLLVEAIKEQQTEIEQLRASLKTIAASPHN